MTKQITLEEALDLVSFERNKGGFWQVRSVHSYIHGNIYGDIYGSVYGTINGRRWKSVETPKDKLQRLLDEVSEEELLKLINQLEDN